MKNKVFYGLVIVFVLIQSLVFASNFDYSQDYMDGRKWEPVTIYGPDGSEAGTIQAVSAYQPVATAPDGYTALENYIGTDGQLHYAGESMIVYDENGSTGTFKMENEISFNTPNVNGTENKPTIEYNAIPAVITEKTDANGNVVTGYDNLMVLGGEYTGEIYSSVEELCNNWNQEGTNYKLLEAYGYTEWTPEVYDAICMNDIYDESIFYDHAVNSKLSTVNIIKTEDGRILIQINTDSEIGLYTIEGLGASEETMIYLWEYQLLFTTNGEIDSIEELIEIKTSGSGGEPKGGKWSDYGAASMSANVYSDQYNVSQAIPTSENITGTVSATDISFYYSVDKTYMTVSYEFTAHLSWDWWEGWISVPVGTNSKGQTIYDSEWWEGYTDGETTTVTGSFTTHYFNVVRAEMSKLSGASVSNQTTGVLATAGPANVSGSLSRSGGVFIDESYLPESVSGADHDSRDGAYAAAQSAADAAVKKATFAVNDTMIMKDGGLFGITPVGEEFGPTPYDQYSSLSSPSVEYLGGSGTKMIPENKTNGWYTSSASASYAMVPSFDGKSDSAGATPPNVFVHTPVVNKSTVTPDSFINQKVVQEGGLTYLQLDKGFTITIPDDGTHIGVQGYGTRTYNSYQAVPKKVTNWGKIKDVKVPFDAYLKQGTEMILIKANTWLSDYSNINTTVNSFKFLVPVWSEEAKGTIETRVVAENIVSYSNASTGLLQEGANLDSTKYIAEKKIPVEVVGKIYDLRISSTNDPGWPGIKGEEGPYVTSPEFPFGQKNQNAMPQYQYAPKLGYLVEFDFKTKGVKTDNVNVSIQPEGFYFISKNGGNAEKVDLYFKTVSNQYVKIEPGPNNSDIIVNLSNEFMKVAKSEIIDSTRIMKQQVGVLYTYAQEVLIGKLPSLNIPEKLRLCYNNFAEYVSNGSGPKLYGKPEAAIANDATGGLSYSTGKYDKVNNGRDTVIASVGHWYAAYRLPSSTVAVKPGTTAKQIMTNPNVIKKNGYILVKFDIVGKNGDEDYLRYTGPESIMEPGTFEDDRKWQDPSGNPDPTNPNQPVQLPNNKPGTIPDGTVILFETDWRANNDSEVIGTH